jgi:hypothetical protein
MGKRYGKPYSLEIPRFAAMYDEALNHWWAFLEDMVCDDALEAEVLAENEWFNAFNVRAALSALADAWHPEALAQLRARYPQVLSRKRIGLILAGNLPLVGLHDLLMVLLSGHDAVVKPSHKDRILLGRLLAHAPESLRARIARVTEIVPGDIDYLLATGSNATARQIQETFGALPHFIRQNRFSVAVLAGDESAAQLEGLAADILTYHGMGCRSVSSILVPPGYDLQPLVAAMDAWHPDCFAAPWADVLRYERAVAQVLGSKEPVCKYIVLQHSPEVKPPKIGILNVVECRNAAERDAQLASILPDLQCIVGAGHLPFGQAQQPGIDDFADGVDTLALLTNL